jgi:hypothetical protein
LVRARVKPNSDAFSWTFSAPSGQVNPTQLEQAASWPFTSTLSPAAKVRTEISSVLLPAPFRPMIAALSPSSIPKEISLRA